MQVIAKIFKAGNSQAVRLPKAFRLDATEMWISKNDITGEITLKPVINNESKLDTLFRLLKENPLPADFLAEREYAAPRNPFAEETEQPSHSSESKKP